MSDLILEKLQTQCSIFELHQKTNIGYPILRSLLAELISDGRIAHTFKNTYPSPTVIYFTKHGY